MPLSVVMRCIMPCERIPPSCYSQCIVCFLERPPLSICRYFDETGSSMMKFAETSRTAREVLFTHDKNKNSFYELQPRKEPQFWKGLPMRLIFTWKHSLPTTPRSFSFEVAMIAPKWPEVDFVKNGMPILPLRSSPSTKTPRIRMTTFLSYRSYGPM